jgi:hypothetical protein
MTNFDFFQRNVKWLMLFEWCNCVLFFGRKVLQSFFPFNAKMYLTKKLIIINSTFKIDLLLSPSGYVNETNWKSEEISWNKWEMQKNYILRKSLTICQIGVLKTGYNSRHSLIIKKQCYRFFVQQKLLNVIIMSTGSNWQRLILSSLKLCKNVIN